MFDKDTVIGYQMSLPSDLHYIKRWKFVWWVSALPKREVISCLRPEFVASTCSRLPERAFLDGFPVGKRGTFGPPGNLSVARWKNNSCCTSNIIPWWPGMDVAILSPPLLLPTISPHLCRFLSPSTTYLRVRPTSTFPMPSVSCSTAGCCLRKRRATPPDSRQ